MAFTPETLRRRARWAYEMGRLRLALPWAVLVSAVGIMAARIVGAGTFGGVMTAVAALAAAACVCHGRDLGRGVWPGVWVGSAAVVLALVAWLCESRGASGFLECRLPCLLAGVTIGVGSASRAGRGAGTLARLAATAAIATPLALIVCAGLGTGALLGLAAGLAVGAVPLLVVRPA